MLHCAGEPEEVFSPFVSVDGEVDKNSNASILPPWEDVQLPEASSEAALPQAVPDVDHSLRILTAGVSLSHPGVSAAVTAGACCVSAGFAAARLHCRCS